VMTPAAFARLKSGVAVYCSACERAHIVPRSALRLEGADQLATLIARTAHHARSDLAAE
jgi:hypothetical protein